jgi:DHA1 family tetracycline resistance protein-like MFS transporter
MTGRLPLAFILLTVMIDSMGIGLILPVMPSLIEEVGGLTLAEAAIWGGILTTSYAVMQFVFSPIVGNLSDRFGRRPVMLVSLAVMALDYLVMAVAGSLWLLLAGRIVGGIAAATHSTANAFMADISEPHQKAARFGLVGAAFGIGFVLGPLLGGIMAEFGTRAPFYAAAALAALNLVFGLLVMPETLPARLRRPFRLARANPFGAFLSVGRLPGVGRLLTMFFLYQVAFMVYPAVWSYFATARFGWEPRMIGFSLAAFGIAMALVQGGLIRVILRVLGERKTVFYGLVFNLFAFMALGLVESGTVAMILTPLTALGAVVTPALQGIMSRTAPDDAQGELQGVISSTASLAMVVSPLIMTQVFAAFTAPGAGVFMPGAPFLVSSLLMVACMGVFLARPRQAMA